MTFADEIRAAIRDNRAGWTQAEIATKTGVNRSRLCRFMRDRTEGRAWISEEPLNRIAEFLGLEVRAPGRK